MKLRRWILRAVFGLLALLALAQIGVRVLDRMLIASSRRYVEDLYPLVAALDEYAEHHACRYPASLAELAAADEHGHGNWRHVDESGTPCDAWGTAFVYVVPAAPGVRPIIYSVGPDRSSGTDDDLHVEGE